MSSSEQIKSRLSIVDVVQSYIKLQKAGAYYKANCPFHNEKTPSFFVTPSRDTFHCFGCGKGGDIFTFVMEMEGVEFVEALKILAARAGVELTPVDPREADHRSRILRLVEIASTFFQSELAKEENKRVYDYLLERGLEKKTIKDFAIGYAPEGWHNLCAFLKTKKFTDEEIESAGLAIKSQGAGYQTKIYDRFRGRIMFPICDSNGRPVGFSGRILPWLQDGQREAAKYVNTPQTILYDKSRLLYGFDRAKNEIRKKDCCILVEGQMDVIMSHQGGIINAVAVSGTALTKEHLTMIKRLTNNIVMAFDRDAAGIGASGRGVDMALADGFEVKIAVIPSGKDPADAVKENPEEWRRAVDGAENLIKFFLDLSDSVKEVEKNVLPYITVLPSEMEKAKWIRETAHKLNIKEDAVWAEMKKIKVEVGRYEDVKKTAKDKEKITEARKKEKIKLEIARDQLTGFVLWQKSLKEGAIEDFIDDFIKDKNFDFINKFIEESAGRSNLEEKEKLIFSAEFFYGGHDTELLKTEFKTLALAYEKERLRTERDDIARKIQGAEKSGDGAKLEEYSRDFNQLTKQINELNYK